MSSVDLDETLRRLRAELTTATTFDGDEESSESKKFSVDELSSLLSTLRSLNDQARELTDISKAIPEVSQRVLEDNLHLESQLTDIDTDVRRERGAIRKEIQGNKDALLKQVQGLQDQLQQQTLAVGGDLDRLAANRRAALQEREQLLQRLADAQDELQREEQANNDIEATNTDLLAQTEEIKELLGPTAEELFSLKNELDEAEAKCLELRAQKDRRLAVMREQQALLSWNKQIFGSFGVDFENDELSEAKLERITSGLTSRRTQMLKELDQKKAVLSDLHASIATLETNSSFLGSLLEGLSPGSTTDPLTPSRAAAVCTLAQIDRWVQLIEQDQLSVLDLSRRGIGPSAAVRIANAVQRSASLRTLILDGNPLGPAGGAAVAQMIRANRSLAWLSLERTELGPIGVNDIASALKVNKTLLVLGLGHNRIDWGVEVLADALRSNSSLTILGLDNNGIGTTGAVKLASVLSVNSSLLVLALENNPISSDGVAAVVQSLRENKTLLCLSLDNTNAGPDSSATIAELLRHNATLLLLGFGYNNIGNEGFAAISAALPQNNSLLMLGLDHNSIDSVGDLVSIIDSRKRPFSFLLGGNPLDAELLEQIEQTVEQHKTLPLQCLIPSLRPDTSRAILLGGPTSPLPGGFIRKFFPSAEFPSLEFEFSQLGLSITC